MMPERSGSFAGGAGTIIGTDGNDTIVGTNSADILFGHRGGDMLTGRGGDDALFGGMGADKLFGGSGADRLEGGLGRDMLSGGAGADVFRFDDKDTGDASSGRADVITDLSANDIIDLRDVEILFVDELADQDPGRGGLSIWSAGGSTYITWNTFGEMRDIELRGYSDRDGHLLEQIRWYDDDNFGTTTTTATIGAGQTRTGTLEVPQDQDWFRIDLVAGKVYDFELDGRDEGYGTGEGLDVSIYDANGNYVDGNAFAGGFPYLAEESGSYYVAVASYANVANATYRLGVTSRVYDDDFGDDLESASPLAPGQSRSGRIDLVNDVDVFSFRVEEGQTYRIDLTSRPNARHPLNDPYLQVVDDGFDTVAWDDDSGPGNSARVTFTAEEDATYYAGAMDWDNGFGAYRISIAEIG